MRERKILPLLLLLLMLSACFPRPARHRQKPTVLTEQQLDTIAFARTHHYTINYNFLVCADSIMLTRQMPEEAVSKLPTDSFAIGRDERLVVADIRILPADSVDSVWVQLAHEQGSFGWVHESEMLKLVEPDDPISQFISFFSDEHLLIFLLVFVLIITAYGLYKLLKRKAHIVHFNDIATFYPTLFALVVATSATLYASIQMFRPESWQEFYFHPTLNPFSQPRLLAVFLSSVWAILIVGIAVVDDTFRHLSVSDGVLYLLGLAGVCAVNYIVFTITTMYYVGYILLVAYIAFALWRYFTHTRSKYICGNCGLQIKKKGRCPHCGALNV